MKTRFDTDDDDARPENSFQRAIHRKSPFEDEEPLLGDSAFRITLKRAIERAAAATKEAVALIDQGSSTLRMGMALSDLVLNGKVRVSMIEPILFAQAGTIAADVRDGLIDVLTAVKPIKTFLSDPVPKAIEDHAAALAVSVPTSLISGQARSLLTATFVAIAYDETLPGARYDWAAKNRSSGALGPFQLYPTVVKTLGERDPTLDLAGLQRGDEQAVQRWNSAYFNDLLRTSTKQTPLPPQFAAIQDQSLKNLVLMIAAHRGGPGWVNYPEPLKTDVQVDVAQRLGMVVAWKLDRER